MVDRSERERERERRISEEDKKGLGLSLWEKGGEAVGARRSRTPVGGNRANVGHLYRPRH